MQTPFTSIFVVVVLSLFTANAFHVSTSKKPNPAVASRHHHPILGMMVHPENNGDVDGDTFDVEAARRKLESIVGGSGDDGGRLREDIQPTISKPTPRFYKGVSPSLDHIPLPEAPPLTSIERERREAEIEMLLHLENGDESLSDLWTLWFQERGIEAAALLSQAEQLSSHPRTWNEAEELLHKLIATYGLHWAEPVNRLSILYYMQGRLNESEDLCKKVLAVKPWHFGALSGIVMVYAGLHDINEARQCAAYRLPTFAPTGSNRRREQWVQKAIRDAEDSLLAADRRLQDSFGKKDDHSIGSKNNNCNEFEFDDEDAWK